ncbi:hypothetical protein FIBSPDRAFT_929526 [Athelia psychrophila]|uniref:Uncharacterized protein n=1 Tax=Athelia psychrophila TaxID=1759441 RepID=A0A166NFJ4_9AGAM|nr:hypothetical protein FIBSPDRAFT_929526 [Fibularhizoctonia sp. CBS 109695]
MDAASSYHAARAPIDTLPNELLSNIFTMGAASPPSYWGRLPFALLVSSISRRWRETAISAPPLWSQLFFTADPRSDSWCADLFLLRSGAHPLDISINLLNRPGSADIVRKLLPYSERWRKLCIRVADKHEVLIIMPSIRYTSVPLLQHFELGFGGKCNTIGVLHGVHTAFFEPGAPALTSVKLRGLCLDCAPPLANLTSYRFDSKAIAMTQSHMESIATASPALRVLNLRFKSFEAFGSGSINLPSLCDLSLNFRHCPRVDGADPLHILAIMLAPALESLELVSLQDYDVRDLSASLESFPNYYLRPQTLKLSCITGWALQDALLGLFPTVTSLYLLGTPVQPTLSLLPILKSITYNHGIGPWYPAPVNERDDACILWLCRHVQDCHGTPRAMEYVRIGSSVCGFGQLGDPGEAHYRALRNLVDLVELPYSADSLRDSWS